MVHSTGARSQGLLQPDGASALLGVLLGQLPRASYSCLPERGRARSQRCPRLGQFRERSQASGRGLSAGPVAQRRGRSTSLKQPRGRCPSSEMRFRPQVESGGSVMETVIDDSVCANTFIFGLITDVLDDYYYSEERIQDIDRDDNRMRPDAQLVVDLGEPVIAECDDEEDDTWATATAFTEEAVRLATPDSPSSEISGVSLMVHHENIDEDFEEVFMMVDDDEEEFEMEAASYVHMAVRLAKAAVSAGMEQVGMDFLATDDAECCLDTVSECSTSPDLQTAAVDSAVKMLMAPASDKLEDLRRQAHSLLSRASASGELYQAVQDVKKWQLQHASCPNTASQPQCLGSAQINIDNEIASLDISIPQSACFDFPITGISAPALLEDYECPVASEMSLAQDDIVVALHDACSSISVEEFPHVVPSFQFQMDESCALVYVPQVMEAPKHPRSTKSSHARTSLRSNNLHKSCGSDGTRPCSSPRSEKHSLMSRPVSSSGEKVAATTVRKSKRTVHKNADDKSDCGLPKSSDCARRQKKSQSFAAFRMDSSDRHDEARESSLTRGYDALGVEFHSLDDGADGELQHFSSSTSNRVHPVATSVPQLSLGTRSERRAHVGQGHVPFAAAMEHGALKVGLRGSAGSRSISASAISLDLAEDLCPAVQTAIRKPMSNSHRSTSMGVVRVSKSTSLPAISSSKSSGLLPALPSKQRAADPFAWSMGPSRNKWGSVGSVF